MSEWFPSEQWLEAYVERLNGSETFRTEGAGWGEEWNGDFLFEIRDLPLEERRVDDLPAELVDPIEARIAALSDDEFAGLTASATEDFERRLPAEGPSREQFVDAVHETTLAEVPAVAWPALRDELPAELEELLSQLERYVDDDGRTFAVLELEDGGCPRWTLTDDAVDVEPGYVIAAPYDRWMDLVEGADVVEAVFSRGVQLKGDVTRLLEYESAAVELGDTAAAVRTEYLL